MYGSPVRSGYGDLDQLFRAAHIWPNLQRYGTWLIETQTPIVALALPAPMLLLGGPERRLGVRGTRGVK